MLPQFSENIIFVFSSCASWVSLFFKVGQEVFSDLQPVGDGKKEKENSLITFVGSQSPQAYRKLLALAETNKTRPHQPRQPPGGIGLNGSQPSPAVRRAPSATGEYLFLTSNVLLNTLKMHLVCVCFRFIGEYILSGFIYFSLYRPSKVWHYERKNIFISDLWQKCYYCLINRCFFRGFRSSETIIKFLEKHEKDLLL